ncbi:hypothetical protein MP638_003717 [Amoeboaphelidium occidentale]|nr:hypothetical protein MP638_003717 [Amoeboaphelidium occidentale]
MNKNNTVDTIVVLINDKLRQEHYATESKLKEASQQCFKSTTGAINELVASIKSCHINTMQKQDKVYALLQQLKITNEQTAKQFAEWYQHKHLSLMDELEAVEYHIESLSKDLSVQ